jgi:hypothetical protein
MADYLPFSLKKKNGEVGVQNYIKLYEVKGAINSIKIALSFKIMNHNLAIS